METKIIAITNSDPKYYLTDILKDNGYNGLLPTNTIINKRRPGIGATFCELHAHRHSIIIEPFVTVIEVKKQKMDDKICAVMKKDFKLEILQNYLDNESIVYKKIITTPESFTKVIKVLKKQSPEYRKQYFLLIDECDKLVQHALFRSRVSAPIEEFFKFEKKALVSATPITPSHPDFENQKFVKLDLKPTFDYKKDIKLVVTNNIRTSLRNIVKQLNLKNDGKPIFLFTNCKRTILYFTRLEQVKDDFKVFCAEDLEEKFFKINNTTNVENSVITQNYAKYNAFTSRFFAAVDMEPPNYAHIIMVTNVPHISYSIIDPYTEAIQIAGRDRLQATTLKQQATITHITNLYPDQLSGKDVETEKELYFIERLQDLAGKATHPIIMEFINKQIVKELLAQVLKNDGSVDTFKKDNYDFTKSSRQLYHSKQNLLAAYVDSEYFRPQLVTVKHAISDLDELIFERAKGGVARNKAFINMLHSLLINYDPLNSEHDDVPYQFRELSKEDALLFNAYSELGYQQIVKLGYAKTKIKEEIFKLKQAEGDYPFLMLDRIVSCFKLNIKVYNDEIKATLQSIYDKYNYQDSPGIIRHAKASDIERYFICKGYNGKKKIDGVYRGYYRLFAPIDKISKDLKYMLN